MELLIILLPLLVTFINLIFFNKLGKHGIKLNIIILLIVTLLTYFIFYKIIILQLPNTIITFK